MARTRNIKPSFFTNDVLAECPMAARLLFAGLWTIADREGRLEDRPKKIKAEILPYDDCDVDALLNALASNQFIARYEVAGNKYIQILSFKKHQNPHQNENASVIPEPDNSESTPVQVPDNTPTSPALTLKPSSLNLKPSTDLPDWLPRAAWAEFLEMRKKQRKIPTDRAKELIIEKLDKLRKQGHDPQKVLEQSVVKSWQDVFPLKEDYKPDKGKNKMPSPAGG